MVSTGNRLIITKVLEVHKIIAHGVKGGHFLNEFVDFRQQVSHSIRVKVLHQTSIFTCPVISGGLVMELHPMLTRFTVATVLINTVLCSQGAASITYWVNTGIWSFRITPLKLVSPK